MKAKPGWTLEELCRWNDGAMIIFGFYSQGSGDDRCLMRYIVWTPEHLETFSPFIFVPSGSIVPNEDRRTH
jgi:hypothetical protein